MSRGKWVVLAILATVALIALVFTFRPKDDGLNWIRKYGLVETVSDVTKEVGPWKGVNGKWTSHEFQVKQPIPDQMKAEMKTFSDEIRKEGRVFVYFAPGKVIINRFEN